MASCLQGKSRSSDEAENSSVDSLSFAGLLSTQDQKLQSPPTMSRHQTRKQHSDFAFCQTGHGIDAADPSKYPPADLLISNGRVIPQAFVFHQKQRPQIDNNQPHWKGSSTARLAQRKRSASDKRGSKEGSNRQKKNTRNHTKAEPNNTSRSGLAWNLFKSFVSPCRECKAVKPAVKTKAMPRESFKLH